LMPPNSDHSTQGMQERNGRSVVTCVLNEPRIGLTHAHANDQKDIIIDFLHSESPQPLRLQGRSPIFDHLWFA
jgi:hypothetical protein